MSSDYDIEMTTDDTLELDTIIEKSNKPINPITKVETVASYDVNDLDGIQTNTVIFDPPKSGEYDIHVNGQVLSINVTDASTIPDSGGAINIVGNNSNTVYQYHSEPFNLTMASFVSSFDVSNESSDTASVVFNADGSKLYVCNLGSKIYEYNLSKNYDIKTAILSKSVDVSEDIDDFLTGLEWNNDGTKLFVANGDRKSNASIIEYAVSTAFDIETISFSTQIASEDGSPLDVAWNNDGTKLYTSGASGEDILEYTLKTSFDLTSSSFNQSVSGSYGGLQWSNDGSKLFTAHDGTVTEFSASTAFDISTLSQQDTLDVSGKETSAQGIAFSDSPQY